MKTKGFTLVELLVSAAILTIILSIAIPSFQHLGESTQSKEISRSLLATLKKGRNYSMHSGLPVTTCASSDSKSCLESTEWGEYPLITFVDRNADFIIDVEEQVIDVTSKRPKGSRLYWNNWRRKTHFRWTAFGTTDWMVGSFVYCPPSENLKNAKRLVVNAAGRFYFAPDKNKDGIPENGSGKNLVC